MNFTIKELKGVINKTIGADLTSIGFSVDSTMTWYTRKNNTKDKIKIFVDTYKFLPERLEFTFIFEFILSAVEEEKKKFAVFSGDSKNLGITYLLSEGLFYPELRHQEIKFRNSFTHKIFDDNLVDQVVHNARLKFNKYIFPRLELFSNLQGFQSYVQSNMNKIGDSRFTLPSLVAMRLLGLENLKDVVQQLEKDLKELPQNHLTIQMIKKYLEFAKSN